MDNYIAQAEQQSQLDLVLRTEHRELKLIDEETGEERDVSIWDKFFTMYESLLDGSF